MEPKKTDDTKGGEVVNGFRSCRDLSDVVPLYAPRGLYLKPIAKINVSVNLPQLKVPGKRNTQQSRRPIILNPGLQFTFHYRDSLLISFL